MTFIFSYDIGPVYYATISKFKSTCVPLLANVLTGSMFCIIGIVLDAKGADTEDVSFGDDLNPMRHNRLILLMDDIL